MFKYFRNKEWSNRNFLRTHPIQIHNFIAIFFYWILTFYKLHRLSVRTIKYNWCVAYSYEATTDFETKFNDCENRRLPRVWYINFLSLCRKLLYQHILSDLVFKKIHSQHQLLFTKVHNWKKIPEFYCCLFRFGVLEISYRFDCFKHIKTLKWILACGLISYKQVSFKVM